MRPLYLKSLEIQGFKSFPDKTLITFGTGLTGIVGPNGSGKSNIADAIRWVLGEQSTKTLRGAKMEDVIFSGTQARKAVGFAEVTLTIDNSDGALPVEFSEVAITRRYYRSGDSEFYVNRSSVRLKDIHELLMDTGLGRDGYSIIGQGRIDEILSLKSEDRREIFEEAAGISKYRYRKEEAERKLAGTEENLMRVRDIISELEGQVGPLREQAQKAREFIELSGELKTLEVSLWLDTLDRLKTNLIKAQTDYDAAQGALEEEQRALDALYKASEEIAGRMHEQDCRSEQVRGELAALETERSENEARIAVLKTRRANNLENISRITNELEEQAGRGESLAAQISAREARIVQLEAVAKTASGKIEALFRDARELAASASDILSKVDALAAKEAAARDRASALKVEESALLSTGESIRERSAQIGQEAAAARERLEAEQERASALGRELEESRERLESVANMIRGFSLKAEAKVKKAAAAAEEKAALEKKIGAMSGRLDLLRDMERDYEGMSRAVKAVMQQSARGALKHIRGPVSQLIHVEDRFAAAVEIALGGALQNIVVEREEDAKAAIGFLKSGDLGRATFLPMSAVRGSELTEKLHGEAGFLGLASELVSCAEEYRPIIRQLLGRTAVADHIDSAIRMARKFSNRFRIVTLDGQVLNVGGAMTGGSLGRGTGILTRANERARLERELSAFDEALAKAARAQAEAERERAAAEHDIGVMKNEERTHADSVLQLETAIGQHTMLLDSLRARIDELEAEKKSVGVRLFELSARQKEYEEHIRAAQEEAAAAAAELGALSQGRDEVVRRQAGVNDTIAALKTEAAQAESERGALASSLAELRALAESISGDRAQRERVIAEYRAANEALDREIEEKNSLSSEYAANCGVKREILKKISEEKMALEAERVRRDREGQEKNQELLNLERERARLETKKNQAEMEEHQILDKLWENYELTQLAAKALRVELESPQKAGKRISELRGKIRALGAVNAGAIDEYQRVSERYEFLSSQRDDLDRAKAELMKIIAEITQNMQRIFTEGFENINRNFNDTFVEIFGGGAAQLELSDPSDILNCGIEIKVTLPGKSLKTITLLSGGEKAFVAIALYFAILKVRPTPFCVLDEIEAALDDVNVTRYARYLRRLTDRTQFIAITHRRGTMEETDVLYGVTMQERGVSKLLALNIADVERKLNFKPN